MRKIRIGKDILFVWSILTNGEPLSLSGRNLRLVLTTPFKRSVDLAFETAENTLKFYYKGVEQKAMGLYRLTLWENYGKEGQTALDACNAFELVPATCYESGNNKEGLDTETVNLSGNIEVFTQGEISGSGIPDAPFDGKTYGRNQGEWVPIENTSGDFVTGDELAQALESYATKEEIPNVDSFITNTVDNLINYYKKTETYTQEEINTRLGQITTINFKVVESLPETGESNLIYLVYMMNLYG